MSLSSKTLLLGLVMMALLSGSVLLAQGTDYQAKINELQQKQRELVEGHVHVNKCQGQVNPTPGRKIMAESSTTESMGGWFSANNSKGIYTVYHDSVRCFVRSLGYPNFPLP